MPPKKSTDTVGQGSHLVKDNECIASIAHKYGHFWETVWNDGANQDLRQARRNPYVLVQGDLVTIPPRRTKNVECATNKVHTFKVRGIPVYLQVQFTEDGEPRAHEAYRIVFPGGVVREGTLNEQGKLKEPVDPAWRRATVMFGPHGEGDEESIELEIGRLNPRDDIFGIQARLRNLGFRPGSVDGIAGRATQAATRRFQRAHGLDATGILDGATRQKLVDLHGDEQK